MSGDTTLYEVLEVQPNAIESEIRTNYEILVQENCNDDTSLLSWKDQKFQELTFAFEVLTDPVRRSQYDSYGLSAVMELNLEHTARDYSETECPYAAPEFPYFFEREGTFYEFKQLNDDKDKFFLKKTIYNYESKTHLLFTMMATNTNEKQRKKRIKKLPSNSFTEASKD